VIQELKHFFSSSFLESAVFDVSGISGLTRRSSKVVVSAGRGSDGISICREGGLSAISLVVLRASIDRSAADAVTDKVSALLFLRFLTRIQTHVVAGAWLLCKCPASPRAPDQPSATVPPYVLPALPTVAGIWEARPPPGRAGAIDWRCRAAVAGIGILLLASCASVWRRCIVAIVQRELAGTSKRVDV